MLFIVFIMTYAVKNSATRLSLYPVDIFLLTEIRVFAAVAIVAAARPSRIVHFKERTPPKLGYDKTAVLCVSLIFSLFHTPSASFALNIYAITYINKKTPRVGEFVVDCAFFGVNCNFFYKFKLIFAENTPSFTIKSYIPSYFFTVEITERIPMP